MREIIFMLPVAVRRIIAKRTKNTKTINILTKDTDVFVIKNLGENVYTPPSNLQYFVENVSKNYCTVEKNLINEAIANSHNINMKIAKLLVTDEDANVRCNLAKNDEAMKYLYIQEILANDTDRFVRYFVASNTKRQDIIYKLLKDPEPFVHSGVAYNKFIKFDKQKEISKNEKEINTIISLLNNPNVIPEILDEYVNSPDVFLKRIIAGHLNTRIETLEELKKDKDKVVRKVARYNLKHKKRIRKYSFKFIR